MKQGAETFFSQKNPRNMLIHRSFPDCFGEGLDYWFEVRLHGNALENLPSNLGGLLRNNTELHLHGLIPNPDAAKVGASIVTKLNTALPLQMQLNADVNHKPPKFPSSQIRLTTHRLATFSANFLH